MYLDSPAKDVRRTNTRPDLSMGARGGGILTGVCTCFSYICVCGDSGGDESTLSARERPFE